MARKSFVETVTECRGALEDGLYTFEVVDHLVENEGFSKDDASRIANTASRMEEYDWGSVLIKTG